MTIQDEFRDDLQSEIFDEVGKTVTISRKSVPVYNLRGEIDSETSVDESIVIVPYNIMNDQETYQDFGDLLEGDMDAAVPYDTTVSVGDTMTIETVAYKVKNVQKNYLPDNVVTIIRLTKDLDA